MDELVVNGKIININEQGFLRQMDDWSESFALEVAKMDHINLFIIYLSLTLFMKFVN